MAVHYRRFDGHAVSGRWYVVLTRARKAGVRFQLNSGHRTIAEQWKLFRENMHWVRGGYVPRPGHPLTAVPSPLAPHVRTGRAAHALDVESSDGGETRLQQWLERHGAHPTNPVRGESWHLELGGADLRRLWRRFAPAGVEAVPMTALRDMEVSNHLIERTKRWEGFSAHAYKLPGERYWTIGHGHYGPDVKPTAYWTAAHAERVLRQDVAKAEAAVKRHVTLPRLRQGRYDALVDFVFNVGEGWFMGSTLLRYVNAAQHRLAVLQFARWVFGSGHTKLPGLVRRRAGEARIYSSTRWPRR